MEEESFLVKMEKSILGCYILINISTPALPRYAKRDGRMYLGAGNDIVLDNGGRTGLGDACYDDAEITPVAYSLTNPTTSWKRWYGADCMNQTNAHMTNDQRPSQQP